MHAGAHKVKRCRATRCTAVAASVKCKNAPPTSKTGVDAPTATASRTGKLCIPSQTQPKCFHADHASQENKTKAKSPIPDCPVGADSLANQLVQRNSTHIGSLSRLRPPDTYPHFSKMAKPSCPSPTRRQDKDRFSQPNPRRLMARQEWLSVDRPPEGSPQTRFGQSPTRRQGNSLRADQSGKKGPTTAPAPQAGTCIHLQ